MTIIHFLLLVLLGSLIVGAISVRRAIVTTGENLLLNIPSLITIEMDFLSFTQDMMEWQANDGWNWTSNWISTANRFDPTTFPEEVPILPVVTPSDIRAIALSDYVQDFDYIINSRLQSFVLSPYESTNSRASVFDDTAQTFNVRGTSQTNLLQLEQGTLELIQGRQFLETEIIANYQQSSFAIISESFARINQLDIGSIFSLYHFVMYPDIDGNTGSQGRNRDEIYASIGMDFEVIGLFEVAIPYQLESDWDIDAETHLNTIFVPNWVIEDLSYRTNVARRSVWDAVEIEMPFSIWWDLGGPLYLEEETLSNLFEATLTSLFMLYHPQYFDSFSYLMKDVLPDYHYFVDLSYTFAPIVASMEFMDEIADWILYASVAAVVIVITLINLLLLRERRHEIGVYLALGEKKRLILLQTITEVLIISVTAFTLSLIVGHLLSREISNHLIESEVVSRFEENQLLYEQFPWQAPWETFDQAGIIVRPITPDHMLEVFDISLDIIMIGTIYVVSLTTVLLTTVLPCLYIVKLKPKEILK